MKNYTEDKVLRSLMALGCVLHPKEKTLDIAEAKKADKLGNSSCGKLDFLKNKCGYTITTVTI